MLRITPLDENQLKFLNDWIKNAKPEVLYLEAYLELCQNIVDFDGVLHTLPSNVPLVSINGYNQLLHKCNDSYLMIF